MSAFLGYIRPTRWVRVVAMGRTGGPDGVELRTGVACGSFVGMAWETSNRRSRLPRDWEARRRIVVARDRGRCQALIAGIQCPSEGVEVDHIQAGDTHDLTNLQLLCKSCHAWKTRGEAAAGLRARQAKAKTKPLNESWR